jgi:hypothetical protein
MKSEVNYSHAACKVDVIDEFNCAGTLCRPIEPCKCPSIVTALTSREVVASPQCRFYVLMWYVSFVNPSTRHIDVAVSMLRR